MMSGSYSDNQSNILSPLSSHLLIERLAAYLPPLALPDPAQVPPSLEGAVLHAEIEGFSALAESLAKTGREGADVLSRVLNHYFTPLLEAIFQHNGQVLHLDGMSLLAFFPCLAEETYERVLRRAASVSRASLQANETFPSVQTADGRYSISMRIGIAAQELKVLQLGADVLGRSLVFNGPAMEQARQAREQARWGEMLGWQSGGAMPVEAEDAELTEAAVPIHELFGDEDPLSVFNRLSPYLPRILAQRLKTAPDAPIVGEFRRVVNIFVHLPELDLNQSQDLAALQECYLTVQQVCSGLDGRVHQVVPLPVERAVRLHLTFGALLSNSEDAEHALRAALTVRDLRMPSGQLPTLGVANGNVFTGSVGTSQRQKYVVLGDVVTLSARFAEAAVTEGGGTLFVDRYTRERVGLTFLFGEDVILNLPGWPFPVRASRLLAPRPSAGGLAIFLRDHAPSGPLPTGSLGTLDEVMGGQRKVLVLGEPGQASHIAQRWLKRGGKGAVGSCLANTTDVPYLAWSGLIAGLIGLNETYSRTEKAAKLSEAIAQYAPDYTPLTSWLNQLVGLAQEEPGFRQRIGGPQRGQFAKMMVDFLDGMAQVSPVLLIFRNLQWSDPAGFMLLEQVVRDLNGTPLLFCLTVQPGNKDIDTRLAALPGLVS